MTKRKPSWFKYFGGLALVSLALSCASAWAGSPADAAARPPIQRGLASFYAKKFEGRKTSSGETYDPRRSTAASNTFPLGSQVAVRRAESGRCAIVRINDRMHGRHRRHILDVSGSVADHLKMKRRGVVPVEAVLLRGHKNPRQAAHDPAVCERAFARALAHPATAQKTRTKSR